jgi:hypothetical protein
MELMEIVRNYQVNPMKPVNTVYGKNEGFLKVEAFFTYSYHWI